jgi:spermidine synthase
MGRSVVAVDIDPKNIEFCKKRFENYLREASRQKLVIQEGGKQILKAA